MENQEEKKSNGAGEKEMFLEVKEKEYQEKLKAFNDYRSEPDID